LIWFLSAGEPAQNQHIRTTEISAATVCSWIAGWSFRCAALSVLSGNLYALALTGIGMFGAVTPIGGLLFLIACASPAVVALGR